MGLDSPATTRSEGAMASVTSQTTDSARSTRGAGSTGQDDPLVGFGPNEWIVEDMYQRYLADPSSVDPAWHEFFVDYRPGATTDGGPSTGATSTAPAAATPSTAPTATPAPSTTPA